MTGGWSLEMEDQIYELFKTTSNSSLQYISSNTKDHGMMLLHFAMALCGVSGSGDLMIGLIE